MIVYEAHGRREMEVEASQRQNSYGFWISCIEILLSYLITKTLINPINQWWVDLTSTLSSGKELALNQWCMVLFIPGGFKDKWEKGLLVEQRIENKITAEL